MTRCLLFAIMLMLLGEISCFDPFFPPTGVPQINTALRSTPEGLLEQLVNSYEGRRIDMFQDLFIPDNSFRYYVMPNVIEDLSLNNLKSIASSQVIDSSTPFIEINSTYSYTTYNDELDIHRNLFTADEITFTEPLEADSVNYTFHADTVVTDTGTGKDTVVYDTTAATVRTQASSINITSSILEQQGYPKTYDFDVGAQVFCLVRDSRDKTKWVIAKWFELPD